MFESDRGLMHRFTNILVVPVTDTTTIPVETERAVDLAVDNGARLSVLGVVPQPSPTQRLLRLGRHHKPIGGLLKMGVTSMLTSWSTQFADKVNIDVHTADGHQPIEIVRTVLLSGIDLVVMTTDGSDDARSLKGMTTRPGATSTRWIPSRRSGPAASLAPVINP